jgi:HPt (histidine-containing phosphotransfer) domain-containing protein
VDLVKPAPVPGVLVEGPEETVRRRFAELAGPDPAENRELFALLIDSFVGRAPEAFAALAGAARRGSALETARAAHTLRGDAANLGGTGLGRVLAELEQRGRSGTLGSVEGDLGLIGADLDALCRALRAMGVEWGLAGDDHRGNDG